MWPRRNRGVDGILWGDQVAVLRRLDVPSARANADLLERASGGWEGKVEPRTSMLDLLFTRPGERYPFPESVRVSFKSDVFEFALVRETRKGQYLVTADRCGHEKALAAPDAFLLQLVG